MTGELRLVPDDGVRRLGGGRVLIGGSPLRVLRVSDAGARLAAGWFDGQPVGATPAHRRLAEKLVAAGLAHPRHTTGPFTAADVTVVVPVKDHAEPLQALRSALSTMDYADVVIVDDGSATPVDGATVRHEDARGPAAARNAGARHARTPLIAFLDADAVPDPGWLDPLLAHFADPAVHAVAPRIRSTPGQSALDRFERIRSSLDLGTRPAHVRPGSRVSYVPSAALVVRAGTLRDHHGFDETMRFGEDVDLVWRIVAAGGAVRYEPAATVSHRPRQGPREWLRQRYSYGTAAAPLGRRHGAAVTPVRISVWTAASWALVAAGRPLSAAVLAAASAAALPRLLAATGVPVAESLRLAVTGHLGGGRLLADALLRAWTPLAALALAHPRGRLLVAAALARYVVEYREDTPGLDPVRYVLARLAADAAYGAGVWRGCLRERTIVPLRPVFTGGS